jgi:hypothetical protein
MMSETLPQATEIGNGTETDRIGTEIGEDRTEVEVDQEVDILEIQGDENTKM